MTATSEPNPTPAPDATIATCVEAGPLEQHVVLLVRSLRRFGGRWADQPFLAVTPGGGMPLRRSTLAEFDRLGVTRMTIDAEREFPWYPYMNKARVMAAAEQAATSAVMVWLDGDVLVLREPTELDLAPDEDLVCAARDQNVGSTGPGDPHEPFWVECSAAAQFPHDQMPWIETLTDRKRIRFYLNSGVYAYRREHGVGAMHEEVNRQMLRRRFASSRGGVFFFEQIALGYVVLKKQLRFRPLTLSHNFGVGRKIHDDIDRAALPQANLLHYHDSLWPPYYHQFLDLLTCNPEARAMVEELGPLTPERSLPRRVRGRLRRWSRKRRERQFLAAAAIL